nr:MAG TPA: hypothetical protein [Caudoviricetes sp.]
MKMPKAVLIMDMPEQVCQKCTWERAERVS